MSTSAFYKSLYKNKYITQLFICSSKLSEQQNPKLCDSKYYGEWLVEILFLVLLGDINFVLCAGRKM
jgi:hypothetical protein